MIQAVGGIMRIATTVSLLALMSGTAFAQAALDDAGKPQPTVDPSVAPTTGPAETPVEYGVDLRIRRVYVPQSFIELFTERAEGGAASTGLGLDLVRRRGDVELQLGFEFEHIQPPEGVYINSGDSVPQDSVDYILSSKQAGEELGWFTLEFTFINHTKINDKLAFRYGGGAGIGFITGGLKRVDTVCSGGSNSNPYPGCVPQGYTHDGQAGTGVNVPDDAGDPAENPYNLPPVFPVVNAIVGLQIRPAPKAVINIETGIRTLPFFGVSGGYFF